MNLLSSFKSAPWASTIFFLPVYCFAFFGASNWIPKSSQVKFKIYHIMHNAEGFSENLSGQVKCTSDDLCTYIFSIPVNSFKSRNEDRDKDMMEVIKAKEFPQITLQGQGRLKEGHFVTDMEVSFAGTKINTPVSMKVENDWFEKSAEGQVSFKATDFGIVLPTLLGIPIQDKIDIRFKVRFKKK